MYLISKAWAFCFQTRRFLTLFPIWVYVKQVPPSAGPFLTNFEQLWYRSTRWSYILNIKGLGLLVSDKKTFLISIKKFVFSSCDPDVQWTGTVWTTLKEDQPKIIPVKFGQNPISGLGDVIWWNCLRADGWMHTGMTDHGQNVITKAHLVTMKNRLLACLPNFFSLAKKKFYTSATFIFMCVFIVLKNHSL